MDAEALVRDLREAHRQLAALIRSESPDWDDVARLLDARNSQARLLGEWLAQAQGSPISASVRQLLMQLLADDAADIRFLSGLKDEVRGRLLAQEHAKRAQRAYSTK